MVRGPIGLGALVAGGIYAAAATAVEPPSGFTLCVAPDPPDCIEAPLKAERINECEGRVQAYVATVFRFRECIEAESEREVRRANEALDRWRCKRSKDCQKR